MKKHWSHSRGLPVAISEEERPLGYVSGAFMNPETGQLIGFMVGYTQVLAPIEIEKWHQDYIQVGSADALAPVLEILRIRDFGLKRSFLNGKKVITKEGKALGRLWDFYFDSGSAMLLGFDVSKRFLWMNWGERSFARKDIQEVTERAIVVTADLEEEKVTMKVREPLPT